MGSLILYRYFKGTEDMKYFTSRVGTIILWVILISCFGFLAYDKHHATLLWAVVTTLVLGGGVWVARKRAPEQKHIAQADTEMDMILRLAESGAPEVHLFFRRSEESDHALIKANEAYITFFSPRVGGIPLRTAANHYRFPLTKISLYHRMVSLLKVVEYELADRQVVIHFGWPLSSWWDRLAVGVMVFNLMRLPRLFPQFEFDIKYFRRPQRLRQQPPGAGGNRFAGPQEEAPRDRRPGFPTGPGRHPALVVPWKI